MRLNHRLRALLIATMTSGLMIAACNLDDDFSVDDFSGGGFAGTTSPGGSASTIPAPVRDSICTTEAVIGEYCNEFVGTTPFCELGDSPNVACNVQLVCSDYQWTRNPPADCEGVCPFASTDVPATACASQGTRRLMCEYVDGTCGCARVGGKKFPPAPTEVDAGEGGFDSDAGDEGGLPSIDGGDADAGSDGGDDDGADYVWRCIPKPEGCPARRPHLGETCVNQELCDYGSCVFDDGITVQCDEGTWVEVPVGAASCR